MTLEVTPEQAVDQGRAWGAAGPLMPLELVIEGCETDENIARNIRSVLERPYKPFNRWMVEPHEREVSICGFGPSLKRTWKQLRGDVWACNGAHNWLIEQGVIPKFAMFWDPIGAVAQFVKPHPDVTYMVASRCHPSVFEALEGYHYYVWHCAGDACLDDLLCEFKKAEPMLPGGTAAVTRAMVVVTTMGYRKINIFGGDGSFDGEFTHVKKSIVDEKALEIWCGGRKFMSTAWLAGQAEDFKILAPTLREQGNEIVFYGDGLLPHVARINGFAVHSTT